MFKKTEKATKGAKAAPQPTADTQEAEAAPASGDRGEVVLTAYDNEAENDSTCVCTLTFTDGSTATGSAARTDNLAADQAAARQKALHG